MMNKSLLKNLFAIDHSRFVKGHESDYKEEVRSILQQFYKEGDIIMIWDSGAKIINFQKMEQICINMEGDEEPDPFQIVQLLSINKSISHDHLILITASNVGPESIIKTEQFINEKNICFNYVTAYLIGDESDMSVCAAFTRNCGSEIIELGKNNESKISTSNFLVSSLKLIDKIQSVYQFSAVFESLVSETKEKMMGSKSDQELINKFENLKERLRNSENFTDEVDRKISQLIRLASSY